MNFNNYTQKSIEAVQSAQQLAVQNSHQQMEQVHLLLALLQQEGGLTDIGEITFEPQNESMERFANGIYNMNGQLVKAGTSMAGMPKGIYIVNGKKVVVR